MRYSRKSKETPSESLRVNAETEGRDKKVGRLAEVVKRKGRSERRYDSMSSGSWVEAEEQSGS